MQTFYKSLRISWITGLSFLLLASLSFGEMPAEPADAETISKAKPKKQTAPQLPKTIYVADTLKMAQRSGPSNKHRILAFIESGSSMKVLSQNEAGDWIQVQFNNKTGWVSRQDIQLQPNAQQSLAQKNEQVSQMQANQVNMKEEIQSLTSNFNEKLDALNTLEKSHNSLLKKHEELTAISKDAINAHSNNQKLNAELEQLRSEKQTIETSHTILRHDRYNQGLLHGLFAVIAGALLTVLIPQFLPKKKQNGW